MFKKPSTSQGCFKRLVLLPLCKYQERQGMANGGGRKQFPIVVPSPVITKREGADLRNLPQEINSPRRQEWSQVSERRENTASAWKCQECNWSLGEVTQPAHGNVRNKQLHRRKLCSVPPSRLTLLYFTGEGGQLGGPATNNLHLIGNLY